MAAEDNTRRNKSPSNTTSSPSATSGTFQLDGDTLLNKWREEDHHDARTQAALGPGKDVSRAAVGVMHRQAIHSFSPVDSPLVRSQFTQNTRFAQTQKQNVSIRPAAPELVTFNLAPMGKMGKSTQIAEPDIEVPNDLMLGGIGWEMDEECESDSMGWDMSESDTSRPPQMDPTEPWGCSTTLVTEQSAETAEERIQTSLAIFESGSNRINWHESGRWEKTVGFTHQNRSAVITVQLMNTTNNATAIMFLCTSGDEYVFQTFYRKFTAVLQTNLGDIRAINHHNALPQQMQQLEFNMDGLSTSPEEVERSLQEVLANVASLRNAGTKSQRELTGALVQVVQDNTPACLDLANEGSVTVAKLVHVVCHAMETSDTETMYNCVRVLHILLSTKVGKFFRFMEKENAFDIIAQRLVDTLQREQATEERAAQVKDGRQMKSTRTDSIAPMMCSDMVGLLTIISRNNGATEAGLSALTGVAFGAVPQRYDQVKQSTITLIST